MKKYELLFIVPNKYTGEEVKSIIENIKKLLTDLNCKVLQIENFGKRKLSYAIKNNYHGYYIQIHFEGEPAKNAEISNKLKLTNELLRHIIVNLDEVDPKLKISLKQDQLEEKTSQTPAERFQPKREHRPQIAKKKVEIKEKVPKIVEVEKEKEEIKVESPKIAEEIKEDVPKITEKKDKEEIMDSTSSPYKEDDKDSKKKKTIEDLDEELNKLLEDDIII